MAGASRKRDTSAPRVTRVFLFTDLREYTRYVETHGDVEATRLLRTYRTIVRREVARTNGAEIKTEGDSFYIVFESAVPALDCAVAILKQVQAHNGRHPDRALHVGAALHAGDAVVYDDQYVGGAVIVASRLSSKAAGGELLLSDTMRGLVRTGQTHRLIDRGTVPLKGVSEPIHVWSVDLGGPPPAAAAGAALLPSADIQRPLAPGQLVSPVLVGRDNELAALRTVLTEAAAGRGAIVFVSGVPGVGKSAFARETASMASSLGYRLMAGAALEWEVGLPYSPLLSALRSGFQADSLREVMTRFAPDVAPLLPELGLPQIVASSPLERHRIGRAFTELLQNLSRQAPLLVILEDLHWVDEASIALVQQLARDVRHSAIAVVITYRSDEVLRRHPLSTLIADLGRAGLASSIALAPLDQAQTDALIEATLSGAPLDRETRDAIYTRSEGNPLFIEELLKSLVQAGEIVRGADKAWRRGERAGVQLPETLRDLVLRRLERLRPGTVATLNAASVIGARFGYGTLRQVRVVDESELTNDLREAVDAQLVVEESRGGVPSFAFRHSLAREVIYDDLLVPERQRLHLLVASTLVIDEETPPAIVAEHWSAGGDRRQAARAYEAAGNAALSVNAASEAVAHFEAAITASDSATIAHYLGLARAYIGTDHLKAKSAAQRGIALLTPGVDIASRIDLMHIAGQAQWLMGDAVGNLELARSAVELVRDMPDTAGKADAFEWYANALAARGDVVAGRDWAERALAVATASGTRAIAASALITIASCEAERSPRSAIALVDEAAAVARGARVADVLARAHANGIVYSFAVETERRRFVRLERASEFGRRYGYGTNQVAAFRAFHDFASGAWPPDGTFGVPGNDGADIYVAWVRLLEVFVGAASDGPTADRVAAVHELVALAARQDEPQWIVPWLSLAAVVQTWAGATADFQQSVAQMLAFAGRTQSPDRSLTLLCRGLPSAAIVLLLAGDRGRLLGMRDALAHLDGHAGEPELIDAFVRALDGAAVEPALLEASAAFAERGLGVATALAVWALKRARPDCRLPGSVVTAAAETLRDARATWLAVFEGGDWSTLSATGPIDSLTSHRSAGP